MVLSNLFQISVSVFCIISTIFLLVIFFWSILLYAQLGKLIIKLEEIAIVVKSTSNDAKGFVDRTIASLEAFKNSIFTFEFIRKITTEVIEMVKNNHSSHEATNDRQEKSK